MSRFARISILTLILSAYILPVSSFAAIKIEKVGAERVFGDFVVGPGKSEVTLEPGESKTVSVIVTNRMGVDRVFNLEVEDFTGSEDPLQPIVLLGSERGPYSLKDYITITDSQFTLHHGERAVVPVTISVPLDAEPGGKYGSVLVSMATTPAEGQKGGATAIVSRIGSLFFVTVPGDAKKEGELADFSTTGGKKVFWKGPIDFSILYRNKGNIYLNPYGYITVTNFFGKEVGKVEVKPWFALPNSLRLREVSWQNQFMLGRYKATVSLNRGYDDIIDTKTISFYIFPAKLLLIALLSICVLVFLIYAIISRFEIRRKE